MKSFVVALIASSCIALSAYGKGSSSSGAVHVKGYTRKDGTHVAPHERSAPNGTKSDNWSTKGNANPYTGKAGTQTATGSSPNLNAAAATPAKPATTPAATGANQIDKPKPATAGFSLVKVGMTKAQVIAAIGEPNIKAATMWAYVSAGIVRFSGEAVVQIDGLKE